MKHLIIITILSLFSLSSYAENAISISSPDGKIGVSVSKSPVLSYSVTYDGTDIFSSPEMTLTTSDGLTIGKNPKISGIRYTKTDENVASPFYRAPEVRDNYNGVTFNVDKNWAVAMRVYNDGVAYRWIYKGKSPVEVVNEGVEYNFPAESFATVPYVRDNNADIRKQFWNSFENTYSEATVENLDQNRLIFLPMIVETANGIKIGLTESALESYPGLYLKGSGTTTLKGMFAPYPKTEVQGGHNNLQMIVTESEDYIAKLDGPRSLPWRVAVIAPDDVVLAQTNISYLLGEPSRLNDISWIKPGKVAWEWWNDWNLGGVTFKTGVNNDTYKAYIDFASDNGIEYVILDEGWAVNKQADLMQVVPEINIKELVDYGNEKGVGIILWAGYYAFDRDMEEVCRYYSDLGVKGFKVDFMDRDDQKMTDFNYRAAKTAAKYGLVLDLHGTHKPAGLNRTYPNVLNFEGVNGLEQVKWAPDTLNMMKYDVQIPFIRQMSGPMDYTQGAMFNASRGNFRASYSEPMSQGTRTHQLALYMIFDSPITMLCDSPTNYDREPESRDFISEIPTVWDETRVLDGKMGEYIVTARRKGDTWWIGGITDWTPRDIEIDLSMLDDGPHNAVIFTDGTNAHRLGRDFRRTEQTVDKSSKINVHLAPGGGVAMKIK